MLVVCEDAVIFKMVHYCTDYDVLQELAHNTGERYQPVVGRVVLLSFLVDRCDVCISPVSWN